MVRIADRNALPGASLASVFLLTCGCGAVKLRATARNHEGRTLYLNTSKSYADFGPDWKGMSSLNAPSPREDHCAVWTGTEMFIWGGSGLSDEFPRSGGLYRPASDAWTTLDAAAAPPGRIGHSCVWTGQEVLIWGGRDATGVRDDGWRFNPASLTWSAMSAVSSPEARTHHTGDWDGHTLLIWGGSGAQGDLATGGIYDPATDTWTEISTTGAPQGRHFHAGVWTGQNLFIWGGQNGSTDFADGALWNATEGWRALPSSPLTARAGMGVVVGEGNIFLYGGFDHTRFYWDGTYFQEATSLWHDRIEGSSGDAAGGIAFVPGIYTGSHVLFFGGVQGMDLTEGGASPAPELDSAQGAMFGDAYTFARAGWDAWLHERLATSLQLKGHAIVWTGQALLVWGGAGSPLAANHDAATTGSNVRRNDGGIFIP